MTLAIDRQKLASNNKLAKELGITSASISVLNQGKALPSEETMIKLAELAGLPKEEALIDLNLWRSRNNPEVQKIWQRLSKMIGLPAFLFTFSSLFAKGYTCYEIIRNIPFSIYYDDKARKKAFNFN